MYKDKFSKENDILRTSDCASWTYPYYLRHLAVAETLILPNAPVGYWRGAGGKAQAIRRWIASVLSSIIYYKAEHRRLLDAAATTLQHAFPKDIVLNSILPFLKLPSYAFQGENNEGGGGRH